MRAINAISVFLYSVLSISQTVSADGMLSVKTDPDGIEVWLDDKYLGDSPIADKKLKPGRYTLKLIDPVQHTSMSEEVFIQDEEKTVIEKTIKTKFGGLKVNSTPEGARVYIATELGTTPLSNDFMNPGKYHLEIRHTNPQYKTAATDIVIPRGEVVTVDKTLQKTALFDKLDAVRLVLGAATAGGFIWAVLEQGNHSKYEELAKSSPTNADYGKKADSAGLNRTLGIVIGSVSLIGLEIVAFF